MAELRSMFIACPYCGNRSLKGGEVPKHPMAGKIPEETPVRELVLTCEKCKPNVQVRVIIVGEPKKKE